MKNKKMESKFFELKEQDSLNTIIDKLSSEFTTNEEKSEIKKQTYFDTFDWRLFKKDLTLIKELQSFYLICLKNNIQLDKIAISRKTKPSFWQDFPDSNLKEKLKAHLGIRAIIPILNLEISEKIINILNQDEKTVTKISFNNIYKSDNRNKSLHGMEIHVLPIRGYEDDFTRVVDFISGLELRETKNNLIYSILEDSRNKSGSYTGKLNIKLTMEMTGVQAAKTICFDLLNTVKQNEDGIKKDIDTEFLHDFRVAVRRIRSALTQIKGVLPEKDVNRFKKDFAILGKNTNKLRDLDVYLLEKEKYKGMLSNNLSSGLEPIFNKLEKQRNSEHQKLTKFLKTEKYKKIIDRFENFLDQIDSDSSDQPNANTKVYDLAKGFIWKKYSQVIKKGKKIDTSTPDPQLHNLRIECKKLRYLLEFFSSLFPEKEISITIMQLKKLQDNLGDFNDLYVQQESLKKMLDDFSGNPDEIKKVSASIGGLIATLNQKQIKTRNDFSKSFSDLDSNDNSKIFKELFKLEGKSKK